MLDFISDHHFKVVCNSINSGDLNCTNILHHYSDNTEYNLVDFATIAIINVIYNAISKTIKNNRGAMN